MRVQKKFTLPSLTKQSFKDECNITNIMQRFQKTGQIPQTRQMRYGSSEGDFQSMHFAIAEANSNFDTLTNEVKEKYGNVENIVKSLNDPALASELHTDGVYKAFGIPTEAYTSLLKETAPETPPVTAEAVSEGESAQPPASNEATTA